MIEKEKGKQQRGRMDRNVERPAEKKITGVYRFLGDIFLKKRNYIIYLDALFII